MRSAQVASSGITATFSGIGTATPVMHYIFASDRVARWCMTRQRRCRNNFRTDIANGCVETHRTTPQMDAQCSHQTSNYVATIHNFIPLFIIYQQRCHYVLPATSSHNFVHYINVSPATKGRRFIASDEKVAMWFATSQPNQIITHEKLNNTWESAIGLEKKRNIYNNGLKISDFFCFLVSSHKFP